MFERMTDRARRTIVLAQAASRELHHDYIGTEHLLLGLFGEPEGLAARALSAVGASRQDLRAWIVEQIGTGPAEPQGHIPFTPRAKKVLELSLREALRLGHNYIGTEHILLGLVREGEGVAAQALIANVEGGPERVRDTVLEMMEDAPPEAPADRPPDDRLGAIESRLAAIENRLAAIEELLRRGDQQTG